MPQTNAFPLRSRSQYPRWPNSVNDYADPHHETPKPFIWTVSTTDILENFDEPGNSREPITCAC
jgi:hypothetical protein